MRKLTVLAVGAATLVSLAFASWGGADGNRKAFGSGNLTGYQEVTPAAVSSGGVGSFRVRVDNGSRTIAYELRYSGLSAPATQAHIHFGARFTSGGVSAFLCGPEPNAGDKPRCPSGTTDEAVVTGTIDAADVIGPAGQGILPGELAELVAAMRAGAAYVNVHTETFPMGEIRAQINDGGGDHDEDDER